MKSELSPTHWLSKIMSASVNSRLQNILKPTRIWKHPELKSTFLLFVVFAALEKLLMWILFVCLNSSVSAECSSS